MYVFVCFVIYASATRKSKILISTKNTKNNYEPFNKSRVRKTQVQKIMNNNFYLSQSRAESRYMLENTKVNKNKIKQFTWNTITFVNH